MESAYFADGLQALVKKYLFKSWEYHPLRSPAAMAGWPGVHFRGGVIHVWQISWPLLHNCSLIFRFCDGSLARNSCPETSRATVSSLWASQIALVVARCSFWDRSRNRLGILGDRSRCGAVRILKSLAQDPRHFGRVRSPFRLSRRSCAQILARRSSIENLCRDLATETSYRDLAKRAPTEIL